jgi:hypothetical protein
MIRRAGIDIPTSEIARFCERWMVAELALFGSVLGPGFRSDSDVDLLVTFLPGADWDLFDAVRMEDELSAMIGRPVDLLTRRSIERSPNRIRREAMLRSAEPIYVAG